MKEEKFPAPLPQPLPPPWVQRRLVEAVEPLTHKRNSIRLHKLVQTNFTGFLFFAFVFLSNHLKATLANWNIKVEKPHKPAIDDCCKNNVLLNLKTRFECFLKSLRTPTVLQSRKAFRISPSRQRDARIISIPKIATIEAPVSSSSSSFSFLTSKHYQLKKGQSHKCFTWSQSH